MQKQAEIVVVKANCHLHEESELYWLFSRGQLEFLVKDLELTNERGGGCSALYREQRLPVINLEKHFGLTERIKEREQRYLVIRGVSEEQLVRLIIVTPSSPQIHRLEKTFSPMTNLLLPERNSDALGVYALGPGRAAVVPDIGKLVQGMAHNHR